MMRVAVTSWLILTTLCGPWLCCCSFRTVAAFAVPHSSAPTSSEQPPSCCCPQGQPKNCDGSRPPTPEAPPCPCKQVGKVALVPTSGASADLEMLQRVVAEWTAWPPLVSSDTSHEPVLAPTLMEPPTGPSPSARLYVLQTLRC